MTTLDTFSGYGQSILSTQWANFWGFSAASFTNASGTTVYIGPTEFLGYAGAAFVFLASLVGALETAGQTLVSIEESLDVWLGGYQDGNYQQLLENAEKSDAMEQFLVAFTWDIVFYAMASFWHAFFTMSVGWITALYIFFKVAPLFGNDAKLVNGFKFMLFAVIIGTVDYLSSNAIKNNMGTVLKSMGFLETSSADTTEGDDITLTYTSGTTTTTTTLGADESDVTLDYEKLMYMQDKWFNFFAIQRGVQLLAPYLFMFIVEGAIASVLVLGIIYM